MTLAVETEHLSKQFSGLRAVDDLNLRVPQGIIFVYLGPNGAGKTTTIRMMLGLIEPTSGNVRVLGHDVRREAGLVRERVGVLLEHDGLYERLTAIDNLEYFGRVWRIPRAKREARIRELLEHFDLWDHRNERVRAFSRGMHQKLALARALINRPPLLFLDEPTTGLDAVSAVSLREDLLHLVRDEGTTVFLTTHNLAEAEKMCDRVGVIRNGQLIAEGTPQEIIAGTQNPRLLIEGDGFTPDLISAVRRHEMVENASLDGTLLTIDLKGLCSVAPLVSLLVAGGAAIEGVHREDRGLEEAFIRLLKERQE